MFSKSARVRTLARDGVNIQLSHPLSAPFHLRIVLHSFISKYELSLGLPLSALFALVLLHDTRPFGNTNLTFLSAFGSFVAFVVIKLPTRMHHSQKVVGVLRPLTDL